MNTPKFSILIFSSVFVLSACSTQFNKSGGGETIYTKDGKIHFFDGKNAYAKEGGKYVRMQQGSEKSATCKKNEKCTTSGVIKKENGDTKSLKSGYEKSNKKAIDYKTKKTALAPKEIPAELQPAQTKQVEKQLTEKPKPEYKEPIPVEEVEKVSPKLKPSEETQEPVMLPIKKPTTDYEEIDAESEIKAKKQEAEKKQAEIEESKEYYQESYVLKELPLFLKYISGKEHTLSPRYETPGGMINGHTVLVGVELEEPYKSTFINLEFDEDSCSSETKIKSANLEDYKEMKITCKNIPTEVINEKLRILKKMNVPDNSELITLFKKRNFESRLLTELNNGFDIGKWFGDMLRSGINNPSSAEKPKENKQPKSQNKKTESKPTQKIGKSQPVQQKGGTAEEVGKQFGKYPLYNVHCNNGKSAGKFYKNGEGDWRKTTPINTSYGIKKRSLEQLISFACK